MVPLARVCDDRDLPVQDGLMFLDVNGVRLHALVFGDGPRTLVAVGGWTGSWEVWEEPIAQLTADGWNTFTRQLAETFHDRFGEIVSYDRDVHIGVGVKRPARHAT